MKMISTLIGALGLAAAMHTQAADQEEKTKAAPPVKTGQTPAMSEIPQMKAQVERLTVLMEQLSKESDPEIRRRLMSEATCPQ